MLKITVLLGGNSPERNVSLVSGAEIAKQLRLNGYEVSETDPADYANWLELLHALKKQTPDLVFIGLHGGEGENGILQAMLTGCGFAFTGSGYKASALAMDKLLSKIIAQQVGVPVPAFSVVNNEQITAGNVKSFTELLKELDLRKQTGHLVIKPVEAGSSVGVHIVSSETELKEALYDALQFSDKVLVEEYIDGRELTVTILDKQVLPVVEIKPHQGFYDYPNKYSAGNTDYHVPADLPSVSAEKVQSYAMRVWQAFECSGYGRIDFRYDGSEFYFLEVNTLPGMTPLSLTPMAAKAVGIDFGNLLNCIIQAALSEFNKT
ncbi:MAG: D-alanine--D-alanine ligase [Candidatus Cloacimonadaceae bacterium]